MGVTLAALALPLNLRYATAAGFPATVGIYAMLLPLVAFALTTGSRHLVVGPDATIAALLAAVVGPVVAAGADPTQVAWATALCVGATLLLFWGLRLGGLVRFVSKAVLVGFITGLGIEVLTSQIRKVMAVDVESRGNVAATLVAGFKIARRRRRADHRRTHPARGRLRRPCARRRAPPSDRVRTREACRRSARCAG